MAITKTTAKTTAKATTNLKILAIDTVTEACSVALNLGGAVTQRMEIAPQGHSRLVLDMVQALLQAHATKLQNLHAVAVDVGPGSFTGVRIGIGVAQGLAYGAGLPVIAVGSLETLAGAVAHPLVLPAIDARMQQIYYGLYRNSPPPSSPSPAHDPNPAANPAAPPHEIMPPALSAPQHLTPCERQDIIGVGSGWDRYAPILLETLNGAKCNWHANQYPQAASLSQIAAARGLSSAISPLQLTACYVRNEVVKPPD